MMGKVGATDTKAPAMITTCRLSAIAVVATSVAFVPGGSVAASPATQPTCDQSVTSNITLRTDLTCTGTALVLDASSVIDLGGHTITGDIEVNIPNLTYTIRHGVIKGQITETGPRPPNVEPSAMLSGIVLDGSFSSFGSVMVTRSTIDGNIVGPLKKTGYGSLGVRLSDSSVGQVVAGPFVTVTDSTTGRLTVIDGSLSVRRSTVAGIFTVGTGLVVANSRVGSLGITNQASYALVMTDDTVIGAPVGLTFEGPRGWGEVQITDNHFVDNGIGASLGVEYFPRDGMVVTGNSFAGNQGAGLDLTLANSTTPGTITNNRFVDNGGDGLLLDGPFTVTANTALRNGLHGIDAVGTITGTGNVAAHNHRNPQCVGVTCAP